MTNRHEHRGDKVVERQCVTPWRQSVSPPTSCGLSGQLSSRPGVNSPGKIVCVGQCPPRPVWPPPFFSTMTANAESPWYLEGGAGEINTSKLRKSEADTFHRNATPNVNVPGVDTLTFNPGLMVNFGVGYRVASPCPRGSRGQLLHLYRRHAASLYRGPRLPRPQRPSLRSQSGDRWSRYAGSVNAFYDFAPIGVRFTPTSAVASRRPPITGRTVSIRARADRPSPQAAALPPRRASGSWKAASASRCRRTGPSRPPIATSTTSPAPTRWRMSRSWGLRYSF